jgi:hypothetical protein
VQVVTSAPARHQLLGALLASGLLPQMAGALHALARAAGGVGSSSGGSAATRLRVSFRRGHASLAAAWTAGLLWQACTIRYVRSEVAAACGAALAVASTAMGAPATDSAGGRKLGGAMVAKALPSEQQPEEQDPPQV